MWLAKNVRSVLLANTFPQKHVNPCGLMAQDSPIMPVSQLPFGGAMRGAVDHMALW